MPTACSSFANAMGIGKRTGKGKRKIKVTKKGQHSCTFGAV